MAVGELKLTKGKILLRNKSAPTLSEQSPGNHLEKDKKIKEQKIGVADVRRDIMGQHQNICIFLIVKYFILLVVLQAQRAFYSLDRVWVQISTDIIHQNNEKKGNICASAVCDLINVSH